MCCVHLLHICAVLLHIILCYDKWILACRLKVCQLLAAHLDLVADGNLLRGRLVLVLLFLLHRFPSILS